MSLFSFQGGPSLEQRFESYYNYCNLFNYILSELRFGLGVRLQGGLMLASSSF